MILFHKYDLYILQVEKSVFLKIFTNSFFKAQMKIDLKKLKHPELLEDGQGY